MPSIQAAVTGAGDDRRRDSRGRRRQGYAEPHELLLHYANRHGLITGATGTGKTVTLQILAEGLSAAGVPVVVQDVKGDISGLSRPGDPAGKAHDALHQARARRSA